MSPVATNKWLLLSALKGHSLIFTLHIFCFCRHMWRCGDHLPTSVYESAGNNIRPKESLKRVSGKETMNSVVSLNLKGTGPG